ncbi:MAG: DUF3800 domain-containing protein [Planctomycetes bacterium]|nr:DUF3800 domain-containing protein [Planctomycetota bacterium]
MYIYLDESGDLGFDFTKDKTSKVFVVTMLVCRTQTAHKAIRKAIRRTLSNKVNKRKKYRLQELKGSKVSFNDKGIFFQADQE